MFARSTTENLTQPAVSQEAKLMASMNITGKLANFSARRRWTVLGVWVVVLVAAMFAAGRAGPRRTPATYQNRLIESNFGVSWG